MKNKIQLFFHNLFYKEVNIELNSGNKTLTKRRNLVPMVIGIVCLIIAICFLFIEFPKNIRFDQIGIIFRKMFVPDEWSLKTWDGYWNFLFNTAVPRIFQTIEMVAIATFIGTCLSVPLFILASSNIYTSKWVYVPIRVVLNIFRSIPTFVLAVIATIFFGYNETAGIIAMAMFTTGVIFKLMYEYIETCDMNPFEASRSAGSRTLQSFVISIWPQAKPTFYSNVIYIFEINIRASVVLGYVGAGGIGQLLADATESTQYDKVGAILIPLFIIVVILQLISSWMRRRIQ